MRIIEDGHKARINSQLARYTQALGGTPTPTATVRGTPTAARSKSTTTGKTCCDSERSLKARQAAFRNYQEPRTTNVFCTRCGNVTSELWSRGQRIRTIRRPLTSEERARLAREREQRQHVKRTRGARTRTAPRTAYDTLTLNRWGHSPTCGCGCGG